jgi:hypothetical protein
MFLLRVSDVKAIQGDLFILLNRGSSDAIPSDADLRRRDLKG